MKGRSEYLCYTDGSCKSGKEAPGGWGYCVRTPEGQSLEGYGGAHRTLAKVMEYRAVAEALEALPEGARAVVFSDNQALVENLEKNLATWHARAFAKVDAAILPSARRIDACMRDRRLEVTFQWVRAHNGNAGNERADALARQGAREANAASKGAARG